ncbi:PIN domain-containing protein [Acinetobacter baumannii]|nr:PIN domain-containing protein [Acinetobacter baumannii]
MIVAIDNNVLVSLASDRALFVNLETYLKQNNATLLIPTPVIAEFIAYDLNARRTQLLTLSHGKVLNGSFDRKAALICGEMAHELGKEFFKENKQKVKVDIQILSIAVSNNAKVLLTEDKGIINAVAKLGLNIQVLQRNELKLGSDLFDNINE